MRDMTPLHEKYYEQAAALIDKKGLTGVEREEHIARLILVWELDEWIIPTLGDVQEET